MNRNSVMENNYGRPPGACVWAGMGSAAAATRIAVLGGMAIVTAEIERPCVVSHSGNTVSEWKCRDIFHSYSVKIYLKCRSCDSTLLDPSFRELR